MKKSLLIVSAITITAIGMSFMAPQSVLFQSGAPAGSSGSPSDGQNCTACHAGTASAQTGWITSDVPAEGYTPGETYTISAMVEENGITKFGFQVSPQDGSGNLLGTLIADGTATQLVGQGKYITHRLSSTSGTDSKTWTFDWTAPAAGSGDVTFYGAFNAANGNNQTSGDKIFTSELVISENTSSNVNLAEKKEMNVYPNPSNGSFRVNYFLDNELQAELRVVDIKGAQVFSKTVTYLDLSQGVELNLTNESGVYFVQLLTEGSNPITKKIIIQ